MKKISYICDICEVLAATLHFQVSNGCEMDASGNGYNSIYDHYDVCDNCLGEFYKQHPKAKRYHTYD